MRVIFNALSTLRPKTGIGHYAAKLLHGLQTLLPDGSLQTFPAGRIAQTVAALQKPGGGVPSKKGAVGRLIGRARALGVEGAKLAARASLQAMFRDACRRGDFDLYHEPNFIPFHCQVPTITTIADLSVLLHPEWHPAERVRLYERQFERGLRESCHVLTISEFVRQQIIETLGLKPDRVSAVHLGVDESFSRVSPEDKVRIRTKYQLPEQYLLFVGTVEPRKNLKTLIEAYLKLPSHLKSQCPLVLAGGWGWRSENVEELVRSAIGSGNVIYLGYTPDEALPALYASAKALVFPSLYEGFGLPPLEMLATGGSVISSSAEVMQEVLGQQAFYVDPLDLDGWKSAMQRAIEDDDWLETLRSGSQEHASRYSWHACASKTIHVYRHVAEMQRAAA